MTGPRTSRNLFRPPSRVSKDLSLSLLVWSRGFPSPVPLHASSIMGLQSGRQSIVCLSPEFDTQLVLKLFFWKGSPRSLCSLLLLVRPTFYFRRGFTPTFLRSVSPQPVFVIPVSLTRLPVMSGHPETRVHRTGEGGMWGQGVGERVTTPVLV